MTVAPSQSERDRLKGDLLRLADPEIRKFERDLPRIIQSWAPDPNKRTVFKALLQEIAPEGAVPATEEERQVRYRAMYILCMLARRDHRTDEFAKYLELERAEECASYHHLLAMYLMRSRRDREDMKKALAEARLALSMSEEAKREPTPHLGIQHHFAEVVATMAEAGYSQSDFKATEAVDFECDKARARKCAKNVVGIERSYAKFHATEGRWLALEGDQDGAEAEMQEAIRLEPDGWDRPYRYADYMGMLASVGALKQRKETQEAVAAAKAASSEATKSLATVQALSGEVNARANDAKTERQRHAEMLGFFAGILALILTGARSDPSKPVALLIALLGLTGVLLVAYAALAWLMRDDAQKKGAGFVLSVGATLLCAAVLIPFIAWYNDWREVMEMLR
jgi:hypothetical protein